MALIGQDYAVDDFKHAVAALLPPGEYWSYQRGDPLDKLLTGLAIEFKTTHDETQLNVLYPIDNSVEGWKLADYQTLLDNHHITGQVFDDSNTPNIIYIDIAPAMIAGELMAALEGYRLPHTAFCWTLKQALVLKAVPVHQSLVVHRTTMRVI
jgi:hypothetical protein